jgi:hypothetical protein
LWDWLVFPLSSSFLMASEVAAVEKHMAQVHHNMWVTNSKLAALSVITGGGKWVEIKITADPSTSTFC